MRFLRGLVAVVAAQFTMAGAVQALSPGMSGQVTAAVVVGGLLLSGLVGASVWTSFEELGRRRHDGRMPAVG